MVDQGGTSVTATSTRHPRRTPLLRLPRRRSQQVPEQAAVSADTTAAAPAPTVHISPQDPVLAYFQSHPEPVDLDGLKLDSPGVRALREAGVKLVVPLVSQGELIGLLNLGPRLSEQEYSADDRKLLENLAGQAAPALRVAQLVREQEAEVRRRQRYEHELQVAQLIQENFLPTRLPEPPGWTLSAYYRPAREVGGDFYDFINLPGGELGVVVGDVTDKGVPAALVMASTRSIVRSSAGRLVEPAEVLERVNDVLVEDMPPNMFVTCLYGVLNLDTGRFRFANAGHNLPCMQTPDGPVEPRATGMPLGLLPGATYEVAEVDIRPGSNLLLYSDALPEAHDNDREMFGFPRVLEVVGSVREGELIADLLAALDQFTGPAWEQEDDITLVTLRRLDDVTGSVQVLASYELPSRPGGERAVVDRLREILDTDRVALADDRRAALETAVAEAAMNAMEHGNQNLAELPVEVAVRIEGDLLVVAVTDQGRGAAMPTDVEDPDIEAKLRGDQSPRGWGLFLIRNMVDDMRVTTEAGKQTVELMMRLGGQADG